MSIPEDISQWAEAGGMHTVCLQKWPGGQGAPDVDRPGTGVLGKEPEPYALPWR